MVSNGSIVTVVGAQATEGFSGDGGPATDAQLWWPKAAAVDAVGNMYIADMQNFRIRKVSNGVITTVAGNGTEGLSGDTGSATSAQMSWPGGVAVDPAGKVYFTDSANDRIRVLTPSGASCSASVTPTALLPGPSGGDFIFDIRTDPSCAWAIQGLPAWITFSGNTVGTWQLDAHRGGEFRRTANGRRFYRGSFGTNHAARPPTLCLRSNRLRPGFPGGGRNRIRRHRDYKRLFLDRVRFA
jgi:hypothetical protein